GSCIRRSRELSNFPSPLAQPEETLTTPPRPK
ncbi:hypothetical protein C367_06455, partial [Cryptococcus neoformans Ze90-1]